MRRSLDRPSRIHYPVEVGEHILGGCTLRYSTKALLEAGYNEFERGTRYGFIENLLEEYVNIIINNIDIAKL
jgi:hypothetical protein